VAYDDIQNKCFIHVNRKQANGKWSYDQKTLDLAQSSISLTPLAHNDFIGLTSRWNHLILIKNAWIFYIDIASLTLVFKSSLANTQGVIDLNEGHFDFESIENTDDLVGVDKKHRKLVYLGLKKTADDDPDVNSNNSIKLKLFTSQSKQFEFSQIKVKRHLLIAFKRNKCEIVIYDLNRVAVDECFSTASVVFQKVILDRSLTFDLTSDLKYFFAFQKPRTLYLYRLHDSKLIARVPILIRIKTLFSSGKFIVIVLENNDVLALGISDHKLIAADVTQNLDELFQFQ
jgi:hypothetical protein